MHYLFIIHIIERRRRSSDEGDGREAVISQESNFHQPARIKRGRGGARGEEIVGWEGREVGIWWD